MRGDFIASNILSVCTIELWMSWLLNIPFYALQGAIEEFDAIAFGKLLGTCVSKKLVNKKEESILKKIIILEPFMFMAKI